MKFVIISFFIVLLFSGCESNKKVNEKYPNIENDDNFYFEGNQNDNTAVEKIEKGFLNSIYELSGKYVLDGIEYCSLTIDCGNRVLSFTTAFGNGWDDIYKIEHISSNIYRLFYRDRFYNSIKGYEIKIMSNSGDINILKEIDAGFQEWPIVENDARTVGGTYTKVEAYNFNPTHKIIINEDTNNDEEYIIIYFKQPDENEEENEVYYLKAGTVVQLLELEEEMSEMPSCKIKTNFGMEGWCYSYNLEPYYEKDEITNDTISIGK